MNKLNPDFMISDKALKEATPFISHQKHGNDK